MEVAFTKISALVFDYQQRLLLARGRGQDFFKGFGGKIENAETDQQCLQRELFEEAGVKVKSIKFFAEPPITEVEGQPDMYAIFRYYLVEIEGTPHLNPEDKTEELVWMSAADFKDKKYEVASSLREHIIPELIKKGLLK